MAMFGSDETIVRSSAYDEIDTFGCWGNGRVWWNILNSVGEITAPC